MVMVGGDVGANVGGGGSSYYRNSCDRSSDDVFLH